jgi:ABC-type multidrug transport system ATPase subunit
VLRDVQATLTPLHAFIGPNDSGKSTLLEALRLSRSSSGVTRLDPSDLDVRQHLDGGPTAPIRRYRLDPDRLRQG